MHKTNMLEISNFPWLLLLVASLICAVARDARAEDWGLYRLIPVSAPQMTLEAVGAGTSEGTVVSIGRPTGGAHQKWIIVPRKDGYFAIRPAYSATLVLAASKGGVASGTALVLETDTGQPWQEWALHKNEAGNYTITPGHAPTMGMDDFGGSQTPGARQDLWLNTPGDAHLQWRIQPLAGSATAGVNATADREAVPYPPLDIAPEKVLKGEIKHTTYTRSLIFPGTVRPVTVFIPAQYDGAKPACVYVKTDGYNAAEKPILETLIATGEMPVTIGVFVGPGDVPPPMRNTLGRRNRDFEYDGMGDNKVRFLVEELLPFVAKEFGLKLSDRGNDRCIAGGSSGGIAAFNAAWERPEAFSRVYANSGSFVAFRGGQEFPTLVRKTEAKPIRAYLTTGTGDMENAAGDWFLLDQEMDKALRFAGYDYFFRIINGGHVAGYNEYFPEAMRFLWRGWPAPVEAGISAPRARDIVLPHQPWQEQKWPEAQAPSQQKGTDSRPKTAAPARHDFQGAACNADGEVFFVDTAANNICRINRDGEIGEFLHNAGQANGLSFGADGQLYAVSNVTGKIMRYDVSGKSYLVVDGLPGDYILAMPDGGLYVTCNPSRPLNAQPAPPVRAAFGDRDAPEGRSEVWFVRDGRKTLVASGMKRAAGLAYRPDRWLLSIADERSKWVYSYQINPDGALINRERFFWLHVPDGCDDAGAAAVCYAREGQMLTATRMGVQISADDGPTQTILPLPDHSRAGAVCLGGRDMDTLYAFCGDKIWKRKVKIHAMGAFTPWTSVHATPL